MSVGGCAVWAVAMAALVLLLRTLMPADGFDAVMPHDPTAEGAMARWLFFWILVVLTGMALIGTFCKVYFPWLSQRDEDRRKAEFEARRQAQVEEAGPFDPPPAIR